MAEVPARRSKPRRNVLRKAADSDIHPAEPRTGTGASSGGGSSSRASSGGGGRVTGRAARTGGGRTDRG